MQWLTEETGWLLPEDGSHLTAEYRDPETLARLGAGIAAASVRCMIGSDDSPAGRSAALTLCGSISAAGGSACYAPDCFPAALQTGAALHHSDLLVHCASGRISLYAYGLLPPTTAQLSAIRQGAAHPDWMPRTEYGDLRSDRTLNRLYAASLRRMLPEIMPVKPEVQSSSALLTTWMRSVFAGGSGERLLLRFSADGRCASVYSEHGGWVFYEKLLLICCRARLLRGEDTALPCWIPHIAETLAAECGRNILRYAAAPDGSDSEARQLAAEQRFTLDGGALCAELLQICAETGESPHSLAESLPPVYTVRRILRTDSAADRMLRQTPMLSPVQEPDGLRIRRRHSEALLHPSPDGRTVAMLVEAQNMEAAAELAGEITALFHDKYSSPGA
ncbi:MAG: hypothetical protein MJ065_05925 [Oscillospiraceae bacterium]|nr:hypothetical protein [Oscillospiraceae bacterium]